MSASAALSGSRISVDIWADISCPWCYIGRRQFEIGLAAFEHADIVAVTYHSYVLNPDAPLDFEGSSKDFLVRHKGIPADRIDGMATQIQRTAAEVGLVYDADKLKVTNTSKAHQVLHLARKEGRQLELVERFFTAFFAEGRHLGRDDVLADLAAEVELDRGEVLATLRSGEFLAAVDADIAEARSLGISSVPFYSFNRTHLMSGAQPPNTITALLRMLYDENHDEL